MRRDLREYGGLQKTAGRWGSQADRQVQFSASLFGVRKRAHNASEGPAEAALSPR